MLLTEKEFELKSFTKEICPRADLKNRVFSQSTFESCDFTESNFTGSKFLDCKMRGTNLSLVKFDGCRLQNIEFENCKFIGVNFSRSDPMFISLKFKNCLIDMCNFSDLNLKETLFHTCMVRGAHFTNTNLSGADFKGSDLQGCMFHNSNLSKANFKTALNYSINPLTNQLKGAKFSKPEVMSLLDHLGIIIE